MVKVTFPELSFGPIEVKRGSLLNVTLLGVGLVIPPGNITLIPKITLTTAFDIFNSEWVTAPVIAVVAFIPQAVWNLCKTTLDGWAREYYEKHPEELK